MEAVRPLLALKPEILVPKVKKHKDEMMLLLLLLTPDKSHYENEVMYNRGAWMKQLGGLELSGISEMPEP